jgi:hypothetical protein
LWARTTTQPGDALEIRLVAAFVEDMMREVAEKVTAARVPRTAH